jgi:hypothetical protein
MTGRTKGWVAVTVLVLLLVGAGIGISQSVPARIRFLAWRARSADPEVRRKARRELMDIGRPTIDPVLVGLFVLEVQERSTPDARVVLTRRDHGDRILVQYNGDLGGHVTEWIDFDRIVGDFEDLPGDQRVVLLKPFVEGLNVRLGSRNRLTVAISCPVDDETEGRLRAEFPDVFAGR